jgi:5-methyltetrahydrofolate--homocysteine methyltransferase
MVNIAKEMQRRGLDLPLLIGGATTSKAHTAAKIAPEYENRATVYVTDASRAVNVAASLLADEPQYQAYAENIKDEYALIRNRVEARREKRAFLGLGDAQANAMAFDWSTYQPPKPQQLGVQSIRPSLEELRPYIDWTPFFMTWELAGSLPSNFRGRGGWRSGNPVVRRCPRTLAVAYRRWSFRRTRSLRLLAC